MVWFGMVWFGMVWVILSRLEYVFGLDQKNDLIGLKDCFGNIMVQFGFVGVQKYSTISGLIELDQYNGFVVFCLIDHGLVWEL